MQKIEWEELDMVSGGAGTAAGSEAAADSMAMKENQASVCGMGLVKEVPGTGAGNRRTVKAYCPVCGRKTVFHISSGAQSKCSVCGNVRLDM